jgi:hypothetical protein
MVEGIRERRNGEGGEGRGERGEGGGWMLARKERFDVQGEGVHIIGSVHVKKK